jgi:flavin-binding protein dodecin
VNGHFAKSDLEHALSNFANCIQLFYLIFLCFESRKHLITSIIFLETYLYLKVVIILKNGEKMVRRAVVSILVLIALIGLSSNAFGYDKEDNLDQADQAQLDQTANEASDQTESASASMQAAEDGKDHHGDVYETVVLIGTSKHSWEDAVMNAAIEAQEHLKMSKKPQKDFSISIVEVKDLDAQLVRSMKPGQTESNKQKEPHIEIEYRATVEFSFKPDMNNHPH